MVARSYNYPCLFLFYIMHMHVLDKNEGTTHSECETKSIANYFKFLTLRPARWIDMRVDPKPKTA